MGDGSEERPNAEQSWRIQNPEFRKNSLLGWQIVPTVGAKRRCGKSGAIINAGPRIHGPCVTDRNRVRNLRALNDDCLALNLRIRPDELAIVTRNFESRTVDDDRLFAAIHRRHFEVQADRAAFNVIDCKSDRNKHITTVRDGLGPE